MARQIVLRLGDEESAFAFAKVEREKLYGKKQRVVVDVDGRACQSAWLTADGTALVPQGGTGHVYVDEAWDATAHGARRAVSLEGELLAEVPSTLGVAQDAQVVPPSEVLDHTTHSVYQLTPDSLGLRAAEALGEGDILKVPFSFRDGHDQDVLFILQNAEAIFGLVTRPTQFAMLSRQALPGEDIADEQDDDLDDELDFSMM